MSPSRCNEHYVTLAALAALSFFALLNAATSSFLTYSLGHEESDADNGANASSVERFFGLGHDQRTFGFVARRRMQFAMLPIMFKLGVISTMLVGIAIMVTKGLTIGIILLFLAFGSVLSKLKQHGHSQPVHFHLHPGDSYRTGHPYPPYEPSGPWDKAAYDDDDAAAEMPHGGATSYHMYPYRRYPIRHYYGYRGR